MRRHFTIYLVLAFWLILARSAPSFAQQQQGDQEVAVNGAFIVPHDDPGAANGQGSFKMGDYFRKNDLVGVDTLVFVAKGSDEVFLSGFYRHLVSTKNPRLFPFVGASAGVDLTRASGEPTGHVLLAKGEVGIKYYLSQRFAFETAYNLEYQRNPGQTFSQNSDSVVLFGFSYIFGGHNR